MTAVKSANRFDSLGDAKPRRRDISAALTRMAVLDAARNLFITKGFEATSLDEIARASESSKGAVYHHFRDKQEIFTELFHASHVEILRAVIAAIPADTTAWKYIELAVRGFLRSYVLDSDARSLLRQAITVLGWDRVRQLDEEQSLPHIRTALSRAIKTGECKPIPVAAAANILFSVYCNAVLIADADEISNQATRDAETVIVTLISGMRA